MPVQNKVDVILGDMDMAAKPEDKVRIEKDERSSVGPSVSGASRKPSDDINWNRKTLRLAFSGNPYERYKTKVRGFESRRGVKFFGIYVCIRC
jgi:hypothetical protein